MLGPSQAYASMDDGLEPGPAGRARHLRAAPSSRYAACHVDERQRGLHQRLRDVVYLG
jgi:hypothetical protein